MPTVAKRKSTKKALPPQSPKKVEVSSPPTEVKVVKNLTPIIYPEFRIEEMVGEKAITYETMRQILGWESEPEYTARMLQNNPSLKPEEAVFGDKVQWLFKDVEGNKVVCWNNSTNRPFDESHARRLGQDMLNLNWAGELTMPTLQEFTYGGDVPYIMRDGTVVNPGAIILLTEGTVNGETLIVGRSGQVESGQHRGVGFMFAVQLWRGKDKAHWLTKWPEEPVLESIIVFGVSESVKVLQTLDNVKPRTLSDVFYTSELYRTLSNPERKECSRMLDNAVTLLWKRSDATQGSEWEKFQTHSTSKNFLDRHPKLLECVQTLFTLNKERSLSTMRLSAGQCAAMLYFMGSSDSDVNTYRTLDPQPHEKVLNWDRWDRAVEFWKTLSQYKPAALTQETQKMSPIVYELGILVDEDTGAGGRFSEKVCILAKAWELWKDNQPFTEDDIHPKYVEAADGKHLDDWPIFGGIDLGDGKDHSKKKEAVPTEEEKEEAKAKARKKFILEQTKKLSEAKAAKKAKEAETVANIDPTEVMRKRLKAAEEKKNGQAPTPTPKTGGLGTAPTPSPKAGPSGPTPRPKIIRKQ